jgi:fucose permease
MYGICFACGSLGAVISLTLGQLIHDKLGHVTLFVIEIVFCILYIGLFYALGGIKQFKSRWVQQEYKTSNIRLTSF